MSPPARSVAALLFALSGCATTGAPSATAAAPSAESEAPASSEPLPPEGIVRERAGEGGTTLLLSVPLAEDVVLEILATPARVPTHGLLVLRSLVPEARLAECGVLSLELGEEVVALPDAQALAGEAADGRALQVLEAPLPLVLLPRLAGAGRVSVHACRATFDVPAEAAPSVAELARRAEALGARLQAP